MKLWKTFTSHCNAHPPDRGTSSYVYDAAGDLVSATDGRGQTIAYTRDIMGRILSKTPLGRPASEVVTHVWDTAGVPGSFGIGQLGTSINCMI